MLTAESQARITQLRAKSSDGSITLEEMREAVRLIRGDRVSAQTASDSSKRSRAKAEIKSADEMLDELTGI